MPDLAALAIPRAWRCVENCCDCNNPHCQPIPPHFGPWETLKPFPLQGDGQSTDESRILWSYVEKCWSLVECGIPAYPCHMKLKHLFKPGKLLYPFDSIKGYKLQLYIQAFILEFSKSPNEPKLTSRALPTSYCPGPGPSMVPKAPWGRTDPKATLAVPGLELKKHQRCTMQNGATSRFCIFWDWFFPTQLGTLSRGGWNGPPGVS